MPAPKSSTDLRRAPDPQIPARRQGQDYNEISYAAPPKDSTPASAIASQWRASSLSDLPSRAPSQADVWLRGWHYRLSTAARTGTRADVSLHADKAAAFAPLCNAQRRARNARSRASVPTSQPTDAVTED